MRRSQCLVSFLFLAGIVLTPSAYAQGLFAGVDIGASEPTNSNYRAHVETGITGNPYVGYMFSKYLGAQGQLHFTAQDADAHHWTPKNDHQWTTLLGATAGPRLSLPLADRLELYGTGQGGVFTGVSGRLDHTAPGFSVGAGLNVNVTPTVAVGLFIRWNRVYMSPRPKDLGPDQEPDQRFGQDAQWGTAGIGFKFSFPRAAAPPPPSPAPVAEVPTTPEKVIRKIVLRGVNFDFDKSNIRTDAAPVLDQAAQIIEEEHLSVVAEGHTDSIGSVSYNLKLSERRASSVRDYLVTRGVPADRLEVKGLGKSQPVASNDTPEGRAMNRRVELHAK